MLRFWNKKSSWSIILLPLSWIYRFFIFIRNRFFQWRIYPVVQLNTKVISIGNITVGGTGKTPFVAYCAKMFRSAGYRVAILSRGYGRKTKDSVITINDGQGIIIPEKIGDEPALLANRLTRVPIASSRNRIESGRRIHKTYGSEVLLLDDGFQHRKLHRDLDIVLIDATNPWGNGYLLPAGPLREAPKNLQRANIVVLTRTEECKNSNNIIQSIQNYTTAPIFTACHRPVEWITIPGQESKDISFLKGKNVLAFSGIGNPDSFKRSLQNVNVSIADFVAFRDHHWYTHKDWDNLLIKAWQKNVDAIVTTEKDAVRLSLKTELEIPTFYLKIELQLIEKEERLHKMLHSIFIPKQGN